MLQFGAEDLRFVFMRKQPRLPAVIGEAAGDAGKHIRDMQFLPVAEFGGDGIKPLLIRHMPPQPWRHAGFFHRQQQRGDWHFAEYAFHQHACRGFAPGLGHRIVHPVFALHGAGGHGAWRILWRFGEMTGDQQWNNQLN